MARKRNKFRKIAKKVGRFHMKVAAKAAPIVTPVLAGVASAFIPGSGLAITAAGHQIARHAGAGAAREKGYHGRKAREKGRNLAKRVAKRGLIATAIGTGVGVGASAVAGTSVFGGLTGALGKVAPKAAGSGYSPEGGPTDVFGQNLLGTDRSVYDQPPGQEAWKSSLVTSLNGLGGSALGGSSQTKGSAGPTRPGGTGDITGSLVDLGTSIFGGGPRDPGEKDSGAPGADVTDGGSFGGWSGTGDGDEGGGIMGFLKTPIGMVAAVVAGYFILRRAG